MSITYHWSVNKVQVAENNLIVKVDLFVTAFDETNKLTISLALTRDLVQGNTFIPYEQLTEQQVLAWCFALENFKSNGEAQVAAQIARQLAQKESEPALPWA
jgi:hypothetical protein